MVVSRKRAESRPRVYTRPRGPMRILRYAYYAFIFSIPFEAVDIGAGIGDFTLSKLIGYMFIMATVLQPSICYRRPPKAFWYFLAYLGIFVALASLQDSWYTAQIMSQFFTLAQLLILFWVSYNLMRYDPMTKGTLITLAVSMVLLSVMQAVGLTSTIDYGRVTAFDENPNAVGATLSLGLLALVGLAYGRKQTTFRVRLLAWLSFAVLAMAIVLTGSRGAIVALLASLLAFLLRRGSIWSILKVGVIILLAIGFVLWASYQSYDIRKRWEGTFATGEMAGREKIFPEAWELFKEKPLLGWGPVHHYFELGARLGQRTRDPHNEYLWILTEVGLLGAIPFFGAMWLCCRAAWRARAGPEGVLPVAMLVFIIVINMKGTWHNGKLFWVVLAYALASASPIGLPKLRQVMIRRKPPATDRFAMAPFVAASRPQ